MSRAYWLPALADGLPGVPVDGGYTAADVANNLFLRDEPAAFVTRQGPSQRYVARACIFGKGFDSEMSLPGGQSGVLGSPFYANLLEQWLTDQAHPLRQSRAELAGHTVSVETIVPASK